MKNKNIHIILVKPQMGENIGAAARVMLNFGIENLKIVAPRDGWPNEKAISTSVGASSIIENAQIYKTLEDAIHDMHYILASTARPRYMNKEVITSNLLNEEINPIKDKKIAILFGPENSGLANNEIVLANKIVTIPVNPDFTSINIAQAIGIICYEISKIQNNFTNNSQELAEAKEINGLFSHLETELESRKFFKALDKKEIMINNLRNMFKRITNFTSQDVKTFRGIIKCLSENSHCKAGSNKAMESKTKK
jgi:tRNA/rRNA methyltransferase